jgi:hypothetical protein
LKATAASKAAVACMLPLLLLPLLLLVCLDLLLLLPMRCP